MIAKPEDRYISRDAYDEQILRNEKQEKVIEEQRLRIEQLEAACTKMTGETMFKKAELQDGEAKLADAKLISDLAINLLKHRPSELLIKYRGNFIVSIQPKS